jgi:hypothetical protein
MWRPFCGKTTVIITPLLFAIVKSRAAENGGRACRISGGGDATRDNNNATAVERNGAVTDLDKGGSTRGEYQR